MKNADKVYIAGEYVGTSDQVGEALEQMEKRFTVQPVLQDCPWCFGTGERLQKQTVKQMNGPDFQQTAKVTRVCMACSGTGQKS